MAESAESIIRSALQELLVQAAEQPIQPNEMSDGIKYLNRMMAAWEVQGYALGFTKIASSSDLVTVPDGAVEAVVLNLAIKLAPQYDVMPNPALVQNARDAMLSVRLLTVAVGEANFPSTLPIGSGNQSPGWGDSYYYDEDDESLIYSETTGNIVQE